MEDKKNEIEKAVLFLESMGVNPNGQLIIPVVADFLVKYKDSCLAEGSASGWVKTSERLPEKDDDMGYKGYWISKEVWAYEKDGGAGRGWFQVYTENNKTWGVKKGDIHFKGFGVYPKNPTYWMPLPLPPGQLDKDINLKK